MHAVVGAMARVSSEESTCLSGLLLHRLNRGADPLDEYRRLSDSAPGRLAHRHSLWKLVADLFAARATNDLLYSSDLDVLISIALRHLADSRPPHHVRCTYAVYNTRTLVYGMYPSAVYIIVCW